VEGNFEGSCENVDLKVTKYYIESNYRAKVRGPWKTDELLYLAESLDLLAQHAGGAANLNDVLQDGAHMWGANEVTFLRLPGLSGDTGNNHAAWCQGHLDKGCVPGAVVFSDDIFARDYQYSRDRFRPSELGLYRNLSADIKVSMIHEMTHFLKMHGQLLQKYTPGGCLEIIQMSVWPTQSPFMLLVEWRVGLADLTTSILFAI
jgi:hypothetical protein